jgi:predicted MPP superfamily phosphohydrolase
MPARQKQPEPSPAAHMPVRIRRFLLSLIPLLGLLHAYIGWRLLPALQLDRTGLAIGVLMLCASTLLLPLGLLARFLFSRPALADRVTWAGSLSMGLFSSVFVLTLLREPLLLIADGAGVKAITSLPDLARLTAMAVLVGALLLTLIGFVNARRIARVVRVDIPLADLPPALDGFTIAQLSDIHVGATIKRDYVTAIVDRVNSLGADLIAITGDVVDGSVSELAPHTAPLAGLTARHGAYVVSGNHEYYSGATAWMEEFRRLGLHGLSNEHVVIAHDGARLVLAGVTDYSAGAFDATQASDPHAALRGSPAGVPRLLLAHQPRSATAAAAAGFDLQLSGHTHGGQFWPWNLFVTLQQPFTAGLHRLGRLWVYTSRGTGYWGPPKRFGAASEITLLRLVASASN